MRGRARLLAGYDRTYDGVGAAANDEGGGHAREKDDPVCEPVRRPAVRVQKAVNGPEDVRRKPPDSSTESLSDSVRVRFVPSGARLPINAVYMFMYHDIMAVDNRSSGIRPQVK